jgi:hypothetical protein
MLMRLLSASLVLVSLFTAWATGPSTVGACMPHTTYDPLRDAEVVVVGHVTDEAVNADPYFTSTVWNFEVDGVIRGEAPESMLLWREDPSYVGSSSCDAHIEEDGVYVLAFSAAFGSEYWDVPNVFSVARIDDRVPAESVVESWTARLSAQAQEAEDEATEDTPWLIVLPLAFAIPLAVLLLPSLLARRRGGGH